MPIAETIQLRAMAYGSKPSVWRRENAIILTAPLLQIRGRWPESRMAIDSAASFRWRQTVTDIAGPPSYVSDELLDARTLLIFARKILTIRKFLTPSE
jgi:hypothetical protein